MRPAVIGVVAVVAIAAAGGTFYGLNRYLDGVQAKADTALIAAPVKPATLNVLVAGANIDAGKTIDPGMFNWQQWPDTVARAAASQGVVVSDDEGKAVAQKPFENTVARISIVKNEPITEDKVTHLDKGSTLSVVLTPGHRSMTIGVDPLIGAGGMVQPGDYVDIVLTSDFADPDAGKLDTKTLTFHPKVVTDTILTNVRVISVDRRLAAVVDPAVPPPTNVTFDVTPEDAEKLIMANRMGRFTLLMRPLLSGPDPERRGLPFTVDTQLMPDVTAALRGTTVDKIDPRENPFHPPLIRVAQDAPPVAAVPAPVVPPPRPAPVKEPSIVVYRYTTPTVVHMEHGHAVVDGMDAGLAPGGSAPSPRPGAMSAAPAVPTSPGGTTPGQTGTPDAAAAAKKAADAAAADDAYYGAVPINKAAAAFTGNTTGKGK